MGKKLVLDVLCWREAKQITRDSIFPKAAILKVLKACLVQQADQATYYVSEKQVVRATRCRILRTAQIVLSICKPNYLERDFIRQCKAAGEPFPVKKVQLRRKKK